MKKIMLQLLANFIINRVRKCHIDNVSFWVEKGKILDSFACGTIQIYHGSPDLGHYFNMDGVIVLTEDFDISQLK